MKFIFQLLIFLICFHPNFVKAQTQEEDGPIDTLARVKGNKFEILEMLKFNDDRNVWEFNKAMGYQDLPIIEELLFEVEDEMDAPRNWCIYILQDATYTNRFPVDRFLELTVKIIQKLRTSPKTKDTYEPEEYKRILIGFNFSLQRSTPTDNLPNSFQFLGAMLGAFFNQGYLKNPGIRNSLEQKINHSKVLAVDKGQRKPAVNLLQAALKEISAQKGKHIEIDGADILEGYIKNLITHLESGKP